MNNDQDLNFNFPEQNSRNEPPLEKESDPTLRLIRQKIDRILGEAPVAQEELTEVERMSKKLSRHQQFIADLQEEGKSASEIQVAWSHYYADLTDKEKREVWQEFYNARSFLNPNPKPDKLINVAAEVKDDKDDAAKEKKFEALNYSRRSLLELKHHILGRVQGPKALKKLKQGGQSLIFGLSLGCLVVLILLFGFFNDRFIAPFITPSRNVSDNSIILDPSSIVVGPNPMIIIPKINVEIPVVYSDTSIDPNVIENSLEDGVVHFPTTPDPGQLGNGAVFGHSSNNILNPGKYKFAFVLLHDLEPGDTFMLEYQSKLYVYQVYKKEIVPPSDTSVLLTQDKPATFSLITCDPPGTSINRLVVVGEQISPQISTDTASAVNQNVAPKPSILPSNSQSLWSRIIHAL